MAQQLKPVELKNVMLADGFWKNRLDINRQVTVWRNFKLCEDTGRLANFRRAAGMEKGDFQGVFFNDSDVYKVMEGAAYILAQHPQDTKLDQYLDNLIDTMAKAQRPDGYLYTFYQLRGEDPAKRFTNLKDNHELYCGGHLIEAGVAHFRATGKRSLLNVAIKYADLVDRTFGADKRHDVCGHEEIELALFKLADATGEQKYAKLADYFVHQRGRDDGRKLFGPYHQDHQPLEKSDQVVGHAVRQMYFLCAAADATAHGDRMYVDAMGRMWHDLVERKTYVTGGVGAKHEGEAFGAPYELPNESAYAETCAGIGDMLWQERMSRIDPDAKYFDALEQTLYNGFLSGVSLSGDKFFYVNPLASKGNHHRQAWYDCACCPPNVVRYMASLPSRMYSLRYDKAENAPHVYVNLYAASDATIETPSSELPKIVIKQETNYPWDGVIKLKVVTRGLFDLHLRIPNWCKDATIMVGDTRIEPKDWEMTSGYVMLGENWKGDEDVTLTLPMPIRRIHADPRVKDDAGRVAIARGPIVYCAEAADNGGHALDLSLPADAKLTDQRRDDLLGGVTVITGEQVTLVPYYAWDNRAAGEMAVWLAEK